MPLPKLYLDVPQDGLSIREPEGLVRMAKPTSGRSRMRLDQPNAPLEGDLQLIMDGPAYSYWRAFWRTSIKKGSLPFRLDLIIDSEEIEECEVKVIPGSYQYGIRGQTHLVALQIEIKRPPEPSTAADQAIIDAWEAYGSFGDQVLDLLAHLVNVDFPADLG